MRCNVCGHDLPDFLWQPGGGRRGRVSPAWSTPPPWQLVTSRPGGHYVLVDTPITLRTEQRPGDFEANVWRIVAEARVRLTLCRDLHPELAALRDAQRGDPMREVPGTLEIIRKAARWIDQGGVLEGARGAGDRADEGSDRGEPGGPRAGGAAAGDPGV